MKKPLTEMSGPELVEAFNELADKKGYERVERFASREAGIRRLEKLLAAPSALPEAAQEAAVEAPKAKKEGKSRAPWRGQTIVVKVDKNPRAEGAKSYALFDAMWAYVKKHPEATAGDVIANTIYRPQDLHWDVAKGFIELKG